MNSLLNKRANNSLTLDCALTNLSKHESKRTLELIFVGWSMIESLRLSLSLLMGETTVLLSVLLDTPLRSD